MSISFKISISGKQIENEYPINIFTRAKKETITWRQTVKENDVQLAYLESPKIISHEAIELQNYIGSFYEDSDPNIYSSISQEIISSKENLIFTTVVLETSGSLAPMFYGHKVPAEATKVTFIPWNKDTDPSVAIYNSDYNFIFSNLENYIDIENEVYNPSFVRYEVIENGSSVIKTEVFKQEPLFRIGTYLDINSETFNFAPYTPVYEKIKLPNGKWKFIVNKPSSMVVYYKEEESLKLKASLQKNIDIKYEWPLYVSGKMFSAKEGSYNAVYDYDSRRPQAFFPYYPYVNEKKQGIYLNSKSILIPDLNIVVLPDNNIHFTLKVIRDGVTILGLTTRPDLIGKHISGKYTLKNLKYYEAFEGQIDYRLSIVSLANTIPIKPTDLLIVDFVKEAKSEMIYIDNINPIQNKKLLNEDIFYYITPKTETQNSKIEWVSYQEVAQPVNSNILNVKTITKCSDPLQEDYIGYPLSLFIADNFIVNPVFNTGINSNSNLYFPVCTVSFNKKKYQSQTTHKDLRVYAGLKEDYSLENKGKDFAFSNILNEDVIALETKNQAIILVDKVEVDKNFSKDIESKIKGTFGVGIVPIIMYPNKPVVYLAKAKKIDSETLNLTLILKENTAFNKLNIYKCSNKISQNLDDSLIYESNKSFATTLSDGSLRFSLNISNEQYLEDIPNQRDKIYIYVKWQDSENNELVSETSSVICVHLK